MNRKEKIIVAAVVIHLGFLILGATHFDAYQFGRVTGIYSQLTGTGSGYGFFAPGVGKGIRATFEIVDGKETKTVRLEPGRNREPDLRVGNVLNALSRNLEDEKLRRSVAASLTARIYSQFPNADSIRIVLETVDIATMEGYRLGDHRADWTKLYEATFRRNTKVTAL